MPWDYSSWGRTMPAGRICGTRVSRQWLENADAPQAPAISSGTQFNEDLPATVRRLVRPYLKERWWRTMFPVDLWTELGFRVIGATIVRASGHGPALPRYNALHRNIRAWAEAIRRTGQLGLIATSWARGTTFCPPDFNIDLTWPSVAELVEGMGGKPHPFWPGVPRRTLRRIIAQLGRCCEDWSVEPQLIEEMTALRPCIREHVYEWKSLMLMTRVLELRKRVDFALLEVDYFDPHYRPVAPEWQRRMDDQAALRKEIERMRSEVRAHFGRRYHGDAFEEWLRELFDLGERRLKEAGRTCRSKKALASRRYAVRQARLAPQPARQRRK
jgi:hypothetical protein